MHSDIIIKKVVIENFRLFKHFEIELDGKRVIVLSGPNGFGKTTLIDAIEWGFTGDIKRISNNFRRRNTTQIEKNRQENLRGQLKHRSSELEDVVSVEIFIACEGIEFSIKREQIIDNLLEKSKVTYSQEIPKSVNDKLLSLTNEIFYPYFICDNYKTYDFLNTPRKDVHDLFKNFLHDYNFVDELVEELRGIEDDLNINSLKIQQDELDKINESIENQKKEINELKNKLVSFEYPIISFYNDEVLSPDILTESQLLEQYETLLDIGRQIFIDRVKKQVAEVELQSKMKTVLKLINEFKISKDVILSSISKGYHESNKIEELYQVKSEATRKKVYLSSLNNYPDIANFFDKNSHDFYNDKCISDYIDQLTTIYNQKIGLEKNIDFLQNGNTLITALSFLVKSKAAFLEYKHSGYKECPLCGSIENFSSLENENKIATYAESYLKEADENIVKLTKSHTEISLKHRELMVSLIEYANILYENRIDEYEKSIHEATSFQQLFSSFITNCYNVGLSSLCNLEENLTLKYDEFDVEFRKIKTIETQQDEIEILSYIYDINDFYDSNLYDILANLKAMRKTSFELFNFDINNFEMKILYLRGLISNNKYLNLVKSMENLSSKKITLQQQFNEIEKNKDIVRRNIVEITSLRREYEKKELESIGPFINNIFKKILKHSNINGIKLIRDNSQDGGLALLDEDGLNLMNVLSQGQLGVLMLSYFFANAIRNTSSFSFKTFFIDDITATLDDLNILAFLDMIKYLIYDDKKIMNQIFFATCNTDVERMLIHKLKSVNIDYVFVQYQSPAIVKNY